MKNNSILYALTIGLMVSSTILKAQSADPYKPDAKKPRSIPGMTLAWNDEFNKTGKPDSKKWNYENGFIRNKELQWFQPANASVINGSLIIEARREKVKNPGFDSTSKDWTMNRPYADYTSASLHTKGTYKFTFGRFDVRARMDTVSGYWPDIWTLGTDKEWPAGGEIDVMEFNRATGKPIVNANIISQLNAKGAPRYNVMLKPLSYFLSQDPDWVKKFHVWSMDWDKDSISLYIDDVLMKKVMLSNTVNPDGFNPFLHPQYLLIDLAVGSYGGDPSATKFPYKLEVDYIRVYQKK